MFVHTDFKQLTNDNFSSLFNAIDRKLSFIAIKALNNNRYGMTNTINTTLFEELITYREILQNMLYCSDCLKDVNRQVVIAYIRKLTNTTC